MIKVAFTENQIQELIEYYEKELFDTEKRVAELKNILSKLKSPAGKNDGEEPEKEAKAKTAIIEDEPQKNEAKEKKVPEKQKNTSSAKTEEKKESDKTNLSTEDLKKEINKIDWENMVQNILKDNKKILLTSEIVDISLKKFRLPFEIRSDLSKKITTQLTRMVKNDLLKKRRIKGVQGFYYGLPVWFSSNGEPRAKYIPAK